LIVGLLTGALALASCTTRYHSLRADKEVASLLGPLTSSELDHREATVLRPEERIEEQAPPQPEASSEAEALVPDEPRFIGLEDSLRLALRQSRSYQNQVESLYLTVLSFTGTRHSFSPLLSSTLAHALEDATGVGRMQGSRGSLRLSKIFSTGAMVDVTGSGRTVYDSTSGVDPDQRSAADLAFTLRQPILRGAGYEVSHDSLIQAERNVLYAIRDFELFREDFAIDVASQFYDLVQQRQSVENAHDNLRSLTFFREQAEALYQVGRAPELDVNRARRSELEAENNLIGAEEDYEVALDRFKIFLGLSIEENLDILDEKPTYHDMRYELASAIDVALVNRLDYLTEKERLEDAERAVRVARNALLPDLDLELSYNTSSSTERLGIERFDDDRYRIGVSLGLPLDRLLQRNGYRSAEIALDRARRDFDLFHDNLILDIRRAFRDLERRRQSLLIQEELIDSERKNVEIADLRFRQGQIPNRDVVEAQENLLDAQNAYIREVVAYEISRLRLLRNLGILFIDEDGLFKP
jgi:outer membrane protein TolC